MFIIVIDFLISIFNFMLRTIVDKYKGQVMIYLKIIKVNIK